MVDFSKMVEELRAERTCVEEAIEVLSRLSASRRRRRGRPPAWLKELQATPRRGRPPGSKNKPRQDKSEPDW